MAERTPQVQESGVVSLCGASVRRRIRLRVWSRSALEARYGDGGQVVRPIAEHGTSSLAGRPLMADLLARLRQAITRNVVCRTAGCDPDWIAQVMFGLEHPSCRHCHREIL